MRNGMLKLSLIWSPTELDCSKKGNWDIEVATDLSYASDQSYVTQPRHLVELWQSAFCVAKSELL